MRYKTAVILVNYKKPEHTIACLRSLFEHCDSREFDAIIIDNASNDQSIDKISKHFPSLTYISQSKNLGFAEGNNRALKLSIERGYKYSLIINNDTIVKDNLIIKLTNHLKSHPNTVAVQPAIYWMHRPKALWNGPGYFNKWVGKTYNKNADGATGLHTPLEPDWLTGCCMLVRNAALQKSGLFNSKFFLYYEDADLSYRLKKIGRLAYLPTAKLYHEAGASAKTSVKNSEGTLSPVIHYYVCRNHLWFIRRYGLPLLYPVNLLYNLSYYLVLLCYFIIRGRKHKIKFLWRGLTEGLFTPLRIIWPNQ
ncbi:glycosyltransferase family 2 protein [Mucilaginibacter ginkgonis]|uniref:Glycosyltransferase family 2 protein n=1 Tax=Mucilaginibacter ginkgonis TaxID=2682091 RepID=A0A6I4I326_9SPHI|nr:glycosyltransferase family 2 protein [Mucilaginibacter ginkgonis]QQL50877.1 glycosyltransferase family 2 protein [Mucilaginibacter ginkgonis]